MYQFPEDIRKVYERQPLSFVYYVLNESGKAVPALVSDGFCRNVGMTREQAMEWLGHGYFERMHPDDAGIAARVSEEFLQKRSVYDLLFRCRIGEGYRFIHAIGRWQTMPDGQEVPVISYSDVTNSTEELKALKDKYGFFQQDQFYNDPLTSLPNINYLREFGFERINAIMSEGKLPAFIYCDVDSMLAYNNQYGFKAGDELLKLVANILREAFPDSLLVRGADDQFIILTMLDYEPALASQLVGINERIIREAEGNTTGLRFGICAVESGSSAVNALDNAKQALKQIGTDLNRPYSFFSKEANALYWKNRYIIENFEKALEERWIKVFYQVIMRMKSQKAAAFEALARWVDPVRGILSPDEMIPVLQKYHLMHKLDLYMFETVCREIPVRYENGLPLLPVSVNFSSQDFDYVDVTDEMDRLYEAYDLARYVGKEFFIVEITEQDVAVGAEHFRKQMKKLKESGYRLWLDDFGSGYSALNMFGGFSFDLIKFDMGLVAHLDENNGFNRVLLQELVQLAKRLNLHTLIEGVETAEQLDFAREIGCELVQGFYYHRPEPLDEILFRIRNGEKVKVCETEEEREKFRCV